MRRNLHKHLEVTEVNHHVGSPTEVASSLDRLGGQTDIVAHLIGTHGSEEVGIGHFRSHMGRILGLGGERVEGEGEQAGGEGHGEDSLIKQTDVARFYRWASAWLML